MKAEKAGEAILELFERHVPDHPGVECRNMFGARAAWVNGNMFMGTFEQDLVLRLPQDGRAVLEAAGGRAFEPMGRPMREYVVVPRAMHDDDTALAGWVGQALDFVAAMPPKARKPPKRTAPAG